MPRSRTIIEQHEQILLSIERLKIAAAWKGGGLSEPHLRKVVAIDLEELGALLAEHFAFEENGGYMHWILNHKPELQGEADRLQHQHGNILAEVNGLRNRAESVDINELKSSVLLILDHLASHEAAEGKFLRQ